ncbi:MAG: acyltransferase family protein [Bacteroidota bacterium]
MDNRTNSERIYALDSLRAIMMLLGIVIHASITFGRIDYGTAWPIKDSSTSFAFDIIVSFIHSFRMPVFFVAAGFFGALLFYRKGPKKMLLNRFNRILLPFLAGVIIIYPLVFFAVVYSKSAIAGAPSPLTNAWNVLVSGQFLPFNVIHLWFLYFLILFAFAGFVIAKLFNSDSTFTTSANKLFTSILENFWYRLAVMSVLFFLCLFWIGRSSIATNNRWSIDPAIFVTYFLFFETGWVIFKTDCLNKLKGYPIAQLIAATILFLIYGLTPWPQSAGSLLAKQILASLFSSLFIFGFIALFMTYFNRYSPRLSYIMDAAYWVYIIHLPIVMFIPGLMAGMALPAVLKFSISFSGTSAICFISYHYLVRGTFIGKFLNGKVHKQKKLPVANELVLGS